MEHEGSYNEFITGETTFPAAIHAWEIYLANEGRTANTIKAFISDVQLLSSSLPPDRMIGSITTRDLNNFLHWMEHERSRKVPCSPKTYSRRVTSIKSFFRWLKNFGIIPTDPAESVLQVTVYAPLPEILTAEEYPLVLEAANSFRRKEKSDARPMALVQLLLATAIKKSETLTIAPNHIDLEDPDQPLLYIRYDKGTQRFKERKINLPLDWVPVYYELLDQEKLTDRIFPYSARRLEYLLRDIGAAAGLTKNLSFNMCRWTNAVHDLYINVDEESIRIKMGVSKVQWREISQKLHELKPIYSGITPQPAEEETEEIEKNLP